MRLTSAICFSGNAEHQAPISEGSATAIIHHNAWRVSFSRCPRQVGKLDINKYETMSAQQPIVIDGDGLRVRDHHEQYLQASASGVSEHPVALERLLLVVSLLIGAISHGYHLFIYPLYITDEGIYMQQAWSVLREGQLSPYTYFYDHAPAGWLLIAGWVGFLPHQFQTFGNDINTGRVLMLL